MQGVVDELWPSIDPTCATYPTYLTHLPYLPRPPYAVSSSPPLSRLGPTIHAMTMLSM